MTPLEFDCRTRIVFGPGTIARLGQLAAAENAKRALVVSDPGVVAAGHTAKGIASLVAGGLDVAVFDRVRENPDTDVVDDGLAFAREFAPDLIVGLGGGSSMDCAKGVNFLLTNGGQMRDYWGVGKATKPMLPMIAVPTTAGTGSETQSFALISDAKTHAKMACGDKKAACRVAILDPDLTATMPKRVAALTGIDAISHAVETYVTKRRNAMSLAFSMAAFRSLARAFLDSIRDPGREESRGEMLLGASLAGMAIENSMLGAAHALANPLTARFDVPHGQAVALMLPHVVRFNGEDPQVAAWYAELSAGGLVGTQTLADWLVQTTAAAGLATRLRDATVAEDSLGAMAEEAAKQWTATFNPRTVGPVELETLYRQAW